MFPEKRDRFKTGLASTDRVGASQTGHTMINSDDIITIAVCTDCIMLIANGEGTDEHDAAMTAEWPDHHFGCGGDDDDQCNFTWSPCQGCGSRLGGAREAAHVWPIKPTVPDCPTCDAVLTLEADGMFRHLGDDGCSFGNVGFNLEDIAVS